MSLYIAQEIWYNKHMSSLFLISTGTILDISIVAIILLFVIVGLCMGFMRSLLSLVRFAGSFVIAFLVRKPCGTLFDKIFKITPKLGEQIKLNFAGYSPALSETISNEPQVLKNVINDSSMSGILKKLCSWMVGNETMAQPTTVVEIVSSKAGIILSQIIAFVVIYVIIRILTLILPKIFKKLTKKSILGKFDRLLGTLFGLVKGVAVVFVMFFVMSLVSTIPSVTDKVTTATQESKICSVLYEPVNNYIYEKLGFKQSDTSTSS